jgi:serine/threonine protein kinase
LATAALNHPNILAVFDIGTSEGSPYVVSELLEGRRCASACAAERFAARKTLDYALQIAHGLAAAHEKGIIHRDLKPDNLFLTKDGRSRFWTSAWPNSRRPIRDRRPTPPCRPQPTVLLTEAGLVMGTAGYMSPEQVRGMALDPRSDIFSFGAILYEMLSGKRAFHGDTPADTMSAILKEDPPELTRPIAMFLRRWSALCSIAWRKIRNRVFIPRAILRLISNISPGFPAVRHAWRRRALAVRMLVATQASAGNRGRSGYCRCGVGLGWWTGKAGARVPQAEYQQITFRTGRIGNARFTPDGSIVYSASWEGGEDQLYMSRTDDPGSRELGIKDAELLSISKGGELAIRLNTQYHGGYRAAGRWRGFR